MDNYLFTALAAGILALLFALWKARWVKKQDTGEARMTEIADHIRKGAMAFLGKEYSVLVVFVIVVAILLGIANALAERSSSMVALSFIIGAICSGLAGFFGMRVATYANVRTANAARSGLSKALSVAFSGGAVMGMSVVGLALSGLTILFLLYTKVLGFE